MSGNFDLLGDPIPEGFGKRGRPPHVPTQEFRCKVMLLLALGWSDSRIASALSVTPPTLKKHYFRELRARDDARDRLEGVLAHRLYQGIMDGNVAAMKEFRKLLDRNDIMAGQRDFYGAGRADEKPEKPEKVGKKDQAALAAQSAGEGSGWGDDLKVPGQRH